MNQLFLFREDDAIKAYSVFNGRYYAGKQLSACFVSITNWKESICGLFLRKSCDKGRSCNYLHVFKDPDYENTYWNKQKQSVVNANSELQSEQTIEDNKWSPVSERLGNLNDKENDKLKKKTL